MEKNYEYRFEIKPSKFVYLPTEECRELGQRIVSKLLKNWTPEDYFYHFGKRGGHVAALRPHLSSSFFASVDLKNFFPSVSRTRVHRSLRSVGYANRYALDIATRSCVEVDGRKFLPYGFVQSMALATLAIEKSLVGQKIEQLRSMGVVVTMYVDDIILSGNCIESLTGHFEELKNSIRETHLLISEKKCCAPSESVEAFNCKIDPSGISILDERMHRFHQQLSHTNDYGRAAILRYVGVINVEQAAELGRSLT
jgi:hypothetical protein